MIEFSPHNPIIRLCIQGMSQEENGNAEAAEKIFLQAWNEATNNFEKYLAAHFIARSQKNSVDKLKWLEITLQFASKINDVAVTSAYPALYLNLAHCCEELGQFEKAKEYSVLSNRYHDHPTDKGPFYHGTKADLKEGDFLTAGLISNYDSGLMMNHIYFTALPNGAGLAAALAKGDGRERVYIVEPTGSFENDPNVTDKKFPGNPTRSYRSSEPLKIVGELDEWVRQTPEQIQQWRERLANSEANLRGKIIN